MTMLQTRTAGPAMAAYRSLAKSRNVSLDTVREAAIEGRLRGKEQKVEKRNLARLRHFYRQKVLGIPLDGS